MFDAPRRIGPAGTCMLGLLLTVSLTGVTAGAQTLRITDYTSRGFAPDLVRYRTGPIGAQRARRLRLQDGNGRGLPLQWEPSPSGKGGVLSFVAELGHDETATYRLTEDGRGAAPKGRLVVTRTADKTVLANGLLSVVLPACVDRRFDTPVKASSLPAPILAFTSGGSGPMGASRILTDRAVSRLRVWVAARAPVYADFWYELTWADGGYYRCRVRVIDRVPLAKVMEEYDLGKLDGTDFWELLLTHGWQPDQLEEARPWGNGTTVHAGSIRGLKFLNSRPMWRMSIDNGLLGHLGFFRKDERESKPDAYRMAGMVMLHRGRWRRANVLEVHPGRAGDVRVRLPMSARNTAWGRDVASVSSPFSMHSFDPAVSKTYGRRHWGLVLSRVRLQKEKTALASFGMNYHGLARYKYAKLPPFSRARSLYGIVGLDRYKDYVLDWPEGKAKYPRLYHAGRTLAQIRKQLDASSLPDAVKKSILGLYSGIANDPKVRRKQVKRLYDYYLRWIPNYFLSCPTPSHHGTAHNYVGAGLADDLLSEPDLAAEQRKDIRARLALIVYLHQEPDVLSYGTGAHPGNPNMGCARFFPGVAYLGLLSGHPAYPRWVEHMARYAEYKLATEMAPGGGWFEYGTYHFHGFRVLPMLASIAAAKPPNAGRIFDYVRADMDYVLNLLTPIDPRHRARMIPGLGNSAPSNTGVFLEAAQAFQKVDPAFAAKLLWAWQANGARLGHAIQAPLGLKPKRPALTSRYFPGFGVIFRAHQGPKETWMLLRNGFLWSHWYIDPGHFTMASRGALLVPYQPYQYYTSPNKDFDMYNTVRFGHRTNQMPYGWPDSNVLEHSFGRSVDYAWSSTGVPDWFVEPGVSKEFRKKVPNIPNASARPLAKEYTQTQGAFQWDRQVLFLKGKTAESPNYFVFRDSIRGRGRLASYLNLNLLGREKNLRFDGPRVAVDTEWPVKLDMIFTGREKVAADLLEENHRPQFVSTNLLRSGRFAKGQEPSRDWRATDGTAWTPGKGNKAVEQHVILRIPAKPGQGYFWVLYPRRQDEPAPTVERLADGVLKIAHPEGTDTVFLSSVPLRFEGRGVSFEGTAGAVRVLGKDVVLALAGGTGQIGYKGKVLEGTAPFEKRFALAGLSAGIEQRPARPTRIAMPAWGQGEPLAPGLRKQIQGDRTRYRVQADRPIMTRVGTLRVEARSAAIEVSPKHVRFVVGQREYVRLAVGAVAVRGMGPFDLTFTPTGITGTVDGRMRTLVTTWPAKITRPMYHMDGRRWYAGWADDPAIGKTVDRPQMALAFAVLDGLHTIKVSEWQFPPMPQAPPMRRVGP